MWEGAREPLRKADKDSEDEVVDLHEKYFKPESGGTWYSRFYSARKPIEAPTEAQRRSMKNRYRPSSK